MNEQETRTRLIYPAICDSGWQTINIREEYPVQAGRLIGGGKRMRTLEADYVLQYNGIKLAVIEAKKDELDYTEGVTQAKKYAKMLKMQKMLKYKNA